MPQPRPITSPDQYKDYLVCIRYIELMEMPHGPKEDRKTRMTYDEAAELMGLSKAQLIQFVRKWTVSGYLAMVRKSLVYPSIDAFMGAQQKVLNEMPAIIDNIIVIAKDSRKSMAAIAAAQWLDDRFARPAIEAAFDNEEDALSYIEQISIQHSAFDPLSLPDLVLLDDNQYNKLESNVDLRTMLNTPDSKVLSSQRRKKGKMAYDPRVDLTSVIGDDGNTQGQPYRMYRRPGTGHYARSPFSRKITPLPEKIYPTRD